MVPSFITALSLKFIFKVILVYQQENRTRHTGSCTNRELFFLSAPPSYAECILGGASIQDDEDNSDGMMGDTNFTPMYPVVPNYQYPTVYAPPPQGAYAAKTDV